MMKIFKILDQKQENKETKQTFSNFTMSKNDSLSSTYNSVFFFFVYRRFLPDGWVYVHEASFCENTASKYAFEESRYILWRGIFQKNWKIAFKNILDEWSVAAGHRCSME